MALNDINQKTGETYLTELAKDLIKGSLNRREIEKYMEQCSVDTDNEPDLDIFFSLEEIHSSPDKQIKLSTMAFIIQEHLVNFPNGNAEHNNRTLEVITAIENNIKENGDIVITLARELSEYLSPDVDAVEDPADEDDLLISESSFNLESDLELDLRSELAPEPAREAPQPYQKRSVLLGSDLVSQLEKHVPASIGTSKISDSPNSTTPGNDEKSDLTPRRMGDGVPSSSSTEVLDTAIKLQIHEPDPVEPPLYLLSEIPSPVRVLDIDQENTTAPVVELRGQPHRFFHTGRPLPVQNHRETVVVETLERIHFVKIEDLETPEVLVKRAETVEAKNAELLNAIVEYRNFNAIVGVAVLSNPVWVLNNGLEARNIHAMVDRIVNDDEALLQSWITTQVDRLTRKFELDREWLDSYIEDFERVEVVHGVHNHHRPEYIANVTVQWPLNRNLDDQRPVGEVINVCNARNRHFLEHLNRLKESLEYNVRLKDTVEGRKANYTEMMFLLRDLLQHEYTEERMEVTKQQMEEARKLFTTKMEIGEQLRASIKEAKALGVPSSKYGEEIEIEGLDRQEVRETVRDRIANARTVAELTERDGALDTLHAFNAIRNVYYKTVPTVSNTAEASHLDDAECLHVVHHAQDAPSILNVTTVNPVALAARLDVMRNR